MPLLLGVVIGLLTSFAAFSGRITALETNAATDAKHLDRLDRTTEETTSLLSDIRETLAQMQAGAQSTDRRRKP